MIGYHATIEKNGLNILKDRVIKLTEDSDSIYGVGDGLYHTTKGYIYLATTIEKALDFGLRAWGRSYLDNINIEKCIYIFEVKIEDKSKIYIDEDEAIIEGINVAQGYEETINLTQSFRINSKVEIGKEILRYTLISFKNMEQGYNLIDSGYMNKSVVWIEVTDKIYNI